jgi:hypothetical protein
LRAAGETETTKENIQDLLELEGGNPGFHVLKEEEIAAMIFFFSFIFISNIYIIKLSIYLFSKLFFFFCLLELSFASLIWIIA